MARKSLSYVHASNETPLLKDACFTKKSPHKINQPDEANASLNYALDCPECFEDGQDRRHVQQPECTLTSVPTWPSN